jgi:hypothetical protein
MRLESVRELKEALGGESPVHGPAYSDGPLLAAGRPQVVGEAGPTVALGVAPGERPGDFQLAIRVQHSELIRSSLIDHLVDAARGEADVTFIGLGFKQSGKCRPVTLGCSVGHPDITAGTLGCFVAVSGGVRILSNNHVLADEGRAAPGAPIVQPGPYDGGRVPDDVVGHLDHVVPLVFGPGNRMDAATATVNESLDIDPGVIPGLGQVAGVKEVDGRERLAKLGRTTGVTRGRVVAFELDGVSFVYERGMLSFDGVMEIAGTSGSFTGGGDSGALVVTDEPDVLAVGLHIGGLPNGHSVAAPLPPILKEISGTLVT